MKTIFLLLAALSVAVNADENKQIENEIGKRTETLLRVESSGFIGCSPHEINISKLVKTPGATSSTAWKATCKNRIFYCTRMVYDRFDVVAAQVGCTEAL